MSVGSQSAPASTKMLWAGRILSGLVTAMILMSAVMKFMMTTDAQRDLDHIGWNMPVVKTGLAVIEATCAIVYAIPQTAVLGAILLTGYLGGACATHVRIGEYGLSLVPVTLGVLAWLGLFLRDARVRALIPLRKL
jgi:hypothetical protein